MMNTHTSPLKEHGNIEWTMDTGKEWNIRGTLFNVLPGGFTSRLESGLSESSIFLTPPPLGSMIAVDIVSEVCNLYRKAEESKKQRGKRNGCHSVWVVAGINKRQIPKKSDHARRILPFTLRYSVAFT